MATQKNGFNGGFTGRLGKGIGYTLNGIQVIRTDGFYNIQNPSDKYLATLVPAKLIPVFLKPVKEFLKLSFKQYGILLGQVPYNMAVRFARKAIAGTYPDLYIDFKKMLFSKGTMPVVINPTVIATAYGLTFSWDTIANRLEGTRPTDQVMLLAYFPETPFAFFLRSGAKRSKGTETLIIPALSKKFLAEIYISFIAEDHSSISDSLYLGQIEYGGD